MPRRWPEGKVSALRIEEFLRPGKEGRTCRPASLNVRDAENLRAQRRDTIPMRGRGILETKL
jgi:hypothetical protein